MATTAYGFRGTEVDLKERPEPGGNLVVATRPKQYTKAG